MFTIAIRKRIRPHGPFKSDVVCPAAASYRSQCCHRSSDVLTHLTLWLTAKRALCTALLFLLLTVSEPCFKSVVETVTYILPVTSTGVVTGLNATRTLGLFSLERHK